MSVYIYNLGVCIERSLSRVPSAQPVQVAGYWANRHFWLEEFEHLLAVIDGYPARLERMQSAYENQILRVGSEHYRDEFGNLKQSVCDTTSPQERRKAAGDARNALKILADRSLDLKIASDAEYDEFVQRLRIADR